MSFEWTQTNQDSSIVGSIGDFAHGLGGFFWPRAFRLSRANRFLFLFFFCFPFFFRKEYVLYFPCWFSRASLEKYRVSLFFARGRIFPNGSAPEAEKFSESPSGSGKSEAPKLAPRKKSAARTLTPDEAAPLDFLIFLGCQVSNSF